MRCLDKFDQKIDAIKEKEAGDLKKQRRTYWKFYILAFLAIGILSFNVYILNGLSIVWTVDGLEQFYPYFIYGGQWLREIASNIASGNFTIPMWSFDLGYGSDLISEMDVFYDPLNLISGFIPEEYSEWGFQFLVIFRLFLAGASFSLFSLHFKNRRWATLLSAMTYCFCGTALTALHWPGSTWPMILFPLLLLGVEKILEGKSPTLFILSSFFFFLITWYFAYMATFFLVVYCAARVILKLRKQKKLNAKNFAPWFFRFAGYYLVGIAIAGFALCPMILDLTVNERATNAQSAIPILYSFTYYMDTLTALAGTAAVGSDCYIGYGGFAFLTCVLLLSRKGKDKLLKAALIATIVILLIPAFGSALNGFNYATNRWVWALALLVCFILARELPRLLKTINKQTAKTLAIAAGCFALAAIALPWMRNEKTIAASAVLIATLGICIQRYTNMRTKRTLFCSILLFGIVVNAYYFTCPEIYGTAKETPTIGTMYSRVTTESADYSIVKATNIGGDNKNDNWRYDADPACGDRPRNNSLVLGLPGISFYNSLYNGKVDQFHTELGMTQGGTNFSYQNLMGSTMAETLMGVKYYVVPQEKAKAPYGYDETPIYTELSGEQRYEVYETENSIGKAFVYDSYISRSDYNKLTPLQRQEALLQGVVVEDDEAKQTGLEKITPECTSTSVDYYELETKTSQNAGTTQKNVYIDNNSFYVLKENASVTLTFKGKPNCETYFNITNFKLNPLNPFDIQNVKAKMTGNEPTLADDLSNLKWTMKWVCPTTVKIGVSLGEQTTQKTISATTPSNHLYGGKDDWSISLGYNEEAQTQITLTFDKVGEYSFDDLSIVCQEMEGFNSYVDKLQQTPVTNYTESTNCIEAQVETDETKVVFFSTPNTPGWSATVDGKEVEIINANTAFIGIKVDAGQHDIKLKFESPGLRQGLAISGIGLLLFLFIVIHWRFKKNKTSREKK